MTELDAACVSIGRKLEDIHVHDDRNHGFGHGLAMSRPGATSIA